MPNISRAARQLAHVCAQKYRERERLRAAKREFDRFRALTGIDTPWERYCAAYATIRCDVREYFYFQFYQRTREVGDTFLTTRRRDCFVHRIGDDETGNCTAPGNKILFNMLFGEFLGREWLNPTAVTPEEFAAFVKKHGRVLIKPAGDGCGHGVHAYRYEGWKAALERHAELLGKNVLAEQMPAQHPRMDLLNPHCLNTARVTTYTDRDDVHILLASLRSTKDTRVVDNFSAGGIAMAIDLRTGALTSDAIDGALRSFSEHPLTKTPLRGFALPDWPEALEMVRRAARKIYGMPRCRFLGWDVAFLATGPAILEVNWRAGCGEQMPHEKGIYYELEALGRKR